VTIAGEIFKIFCVERKKTSETHPASVHLINQNLIQQIQSSKCQSVKSEKEFLQQQHKKNRKVGSKN
jgi:hypothetical protein